MKLPIRLNILVDIKEIKEHTLQERPEFDWEPRPSHLHRFSFPPSPSSPGVSSQLQRRGGGGGGGRSSSSSVRVHHVSRPLLAFMFCLAESPAPAVSASSRCKSPSLREEEEEVEEVKRTLFSLSRIHFNSAQRRRPGSALTSLTPRAPQQTPRPGGGLSWLTGSCPYASTRSRAHGRLRCRLF